MAFPDKYKWINQTVTRKKEMCYGFNRFFTNVGPDLANSIKIMISMTLMRLTTTQLSFRKFLNWNC